MTAKIKYGIAWILMILLVAGCGRATRPAEAPVNQNSPAQKFDAGSNPNDIINPEADNAPDDDTAPEDVLFPKNPEFRRYLAKDGKSGWRVIMLGIDGLESKALDDLIASGRLPNFKRLIDEGAYGLLKTDFADSPITWTTIATGVRCEKHGLCPDSNEGISFEQKLQSIKYPRLWEVAEKFALQEYVAEYYFIGKKYPPCLTGREPSFEFGINEVNPDVSKVLKKYGAPDKTVELNGAPRIPYSDLSFQMFNGLERFHALFNYYGDLFISHFQSTDEVGHYEWGFHRLLLDQRKVSETMKKRAEMGREIVLAVYNDMDRKIGKIRREFPDSLIVICSDHGMHALNPLKMYLILQPDLYELLGLPPSLDIGTKKQIKGAHSAVLVKDVETLLKTDSDVGLSLRTPIIEFDGPGAQAAAQKAFDRTGKVKMSGIPIFKMISKTKIGFNMELTEKWQQLPNVSDNFIMFGFLTGQHEPGDDGVIIFSGPGVKKGARLQGASVEDVAPTIYAYLNIPLAKDLDGKALADAFNNSSLPGLKKARIATYGVAPNYSPGGPLHELTPEEKNRLRSLGYL